MTTNHNNLTLKITDFGRLALIDTWVTLARFEADFGYRGQPLVRLRLSNDGIHVDTFQTSFRLETGQVGVNASVIPGFLIPTAITGPIDEILLRITDRATPEEDGAKTLMALTRSLIEAPAAPWFLRGNSELWSRFKDAMGLTVREFSVPTFISANDNSDRGELLKAMELGSSWFHPIQWQPRVVDGVLEHHPIRHIYLYPRTPAELNGHEILDETEWLHTFLRQAANDLGRDDTQLEQAIASLDAS